MKIIRDSKLCYSCKSCQLACSFHHTNSFWPDRSSISVFRNPTNSKIEWAINSTCDLCIGEESPLCVEFCPYNALKVSN